MKTFEAVFVVKFNTLVYPELPRCLFTDLVLGAVTICCGRLFHGATILKQKIFLLTATLGLLLNSFLLWPLVLL